MKTFEEFLEYLENEKIKSFQFKSISIYLSKKFKIPKSKITFFCKIMKELNMIEQHHESGYCKTVCASCYEYGCDSGTQTPITYWKIKSLNYK